MITSAAFAGKRYAVLGLARSGAATVHALLASGAAVVAWDSDEGRRNAILPELARGGGPSPQEMLEGQGATVVAGGLSAAFGGPPPRAELGEDLTLADPLSIDLTGFDAVVVSPGVPLNTHPIAAHARAAGVPVIGDIELFAQARASLPPHKVVGITGTNGKSTVTALIHHILQTAGVPACMGGNIGLPILSQEPLPAGGVYVLELSSYQIDLTFSLDCDVAVLTNITPDHLDRYESFEAYAASKARLLEMQSSKHWAVFGNSDEQTLSARARTSKERDGRVLRFGDNCDDGLGVSLVGDRAYMFGCCVGSQSDWPALQGPHNAENAGAAIAVCDLLGLSADEIDQALRTYPGLPHRMERVAERGGVLYVNDSKATNATSTAPALAAYPRVHWILGGRRKTDDLDACAPHFGHVVAGYTIGESAGLFAQILRAAGKPVTESGTLDQAVRDAAAAAQPGETVLLSPACASYDQFKDYEARGEAFRSAVGALS